MKKPAHQWYYSVGLIYAEYTTTVKLHLLFDIFINFYFLFLFIVYT